MLFVKKVVPLVLLAVLSGCAGDKNVKSESLSLKKETEQSLAQKIVEGKTTKKGVEIILGLPLSTALDNGLEVWKYELSQETNPQTTIIMSSDSIPMPNGGSVSVPNVMPTTKFTTLTKKALTVIFDKKGIVKKYSYTISERPL